MIPCTDPPNVLLYSSHGFRHSRSLSLRKGSDDVDYIDPHDQSSGTLSGAITMLTLPFRNPAHTLSNRPVDTADIVSGVLRTWGVDRRTFTVRTIAGHAMDRSHKPPQETMFEFLSREKERSKNADRSDTGPRLVATVSPGTPERRGIHLPMGVQGCFAWTPSLSRERGSRPEPLPNADGFA